MRYLTLLHIKLGRVACGVRVLGVHPVLLLDRCWVVYVFIAVLGTHLVLLVLAALVICVSGYT